MYARRLDSSVLAFSHSSNRHRHPFIYILFDSHFTFHKKNNPMKKVYLWMVPFSPCGVHLLSGHGTLYADYWSDYFSFIWENVFFRITDNPQTQTNYWSENRGCVVITSHIVKFIYLKNNQELFFPCTSFTGPYNSVPSSFKILIVSSVLSTVDDNLSSSSTWTDETDGKAEIIAYLILVRFTSNFVHLPSLSRLTKCVSRFGITRVFSF